MKRKVFEFIKANPKTTHHAVARALGIREFDALRLILELHDNGYLKSDADTLDNDIEQSCSSFYSVCKTTYDDESGEEDGN